MNVPIKTNTALSENRRLSDQMYITLLVASVAIGLFLIASVFVPNFFQLQNMLNFGSRGYLSLSLG